MMRAVLVCALAVLTVGACSRRVEVQSAPTRSSEVVGTVQMTNRLTQPVNVYVVSDGTNVFLQQVGANTTESVAVRGIAAGTSVRLRATTIDGKRTFTSDPVVLSGTYPWTVP